MEQYLVRDMEQYLARHTAEPVSGAIEAAIAYGPGAIGLIGIVWYISWVIRATPKHFSSVLNKHLDTLARKSLKLIRTDEYGKVHTDAFAKEVHYFMDEVVPEQLPSSFVRGGVLSRYAFMKPSLLRRALRSIELRRTEMLQQMEMQPDGGYSSSMDGGEYEAYCARLLTAAGWRASVTATGADQGLDILATHHETGDKIAIQCKHYSDRPIGNKAVQEVASARGFNRTEYAAVVSNQPFTKSAKALAASLNVHLLHHADLTHLTNILYSLDDLSLLYEQA